MHESRRDGRIATVSYVSSYFHCVFSTKERRPLITPALRERLWPFLGGIARQNKMKAIEIGGVADHVHVLSSFAVPAAALAFRIACRKLPAPLSAVLVTVNVAASRPDTNPKNMQTLRESILITIKVVAAFRIGLAGSVLPDREMISHSQ